MTNQTYAQQGFASHGMARPSTHPAPVGEPAGGAGYYGGQEAAEEWGETDAVAIKEQFGEPDHSGGSPIGEAPGGPGYWGRQPSLAESARPGSPDAAAPEPVGERPGSAAYFGNSGAAASEAAMPAELATAEDIGERPGSPNYYGSGALPAKAVHKKSTVVAMSKK